MPSRARTNVQLALDAARPRTGHGGWRPGAGRPRGRTVISHDARDPVARSIPQHVTLRLVEGVSSLRTRSRVATIRAAIARSHRADFRIIHFNVEPNHLHLIVEADSNEVRARWIKGLAVRIARRINALLGRSGKLFEERYHARGLSTPREVRNALRYVLNNARHHDPGLAHADANWIDPFSSAAWFDGWRDPILPDTWWKAELLAMPPPVATPTVWLLTTGWRRHGLLAFDEVPGSNVCRKSRRASRTGAREGSPARAGDEHSSRFVAEINASLVSSTGPTSMPRVFRLVTTTVAAHDAERVPRLDVVRRAGNAVAAHRHHTDVLRAIR